jgi:hypothetical protein
MAKGVLFRFSHLLVAEIMTLACGVSAITCRFGKRLRVKRKIVRE